MRLTSVDGPIDREALEEGLMDALDALRQYAKATALGVVGGVDFETSTIELEFTVEAVSPGVMHARIGEIVEILEQHVGLRYAGSREEARATPPS